MRILNYVNEDKSMGGMAMAHSPALLTTYFCKVFELRIFSLHFTFKVFGQ